MKKIIVSLLILCASFACFGKMSQEPVVITKCKGFSARSDDQSKITLASIYRDGNCQCENSGDCDDINKVCKNSIESVSFRSGEPIFLLRAFFPDESNYEYCIKIKAPQNAFGEDAELWASTSLDFDRSTYAIAVKDSEKLGFWEIFKLACDKNYIAQKILDSLNSCDLKKLNSEEKIKEQKVERELVKIFEAMTDVKEGYTSEFVESNDWFNANLRAKNLDILKQKYKECAQKKTSQDSPNDSAQPSQPNQLANKKDAIDEFLDWLDSIF